MKRLISWVVATALVVLVPVSADASAQITVNVSDTVITHGETVTFRGTAHEVKIGSQVRLQRKRSSGDWVAVASQDVSARRTYSFTTTPPRGNQTYRVIKPKQFGQPRAASASLTVSVRWTPTVTLDSVMPVHDQYNNQHLEFTGHSNAIGAAIRLERHSNFGWGNWDTTKILIRPDGTFSARLPNLPDGTFVRAKVPGYGPRLVAYSDVQTSGLLPFELTLDGSPLTMGGIAGSGSFPKVAGAVAHFTAETDDLVTFRWGQNAVHHRVVGPDGQIVPAVPEPLSNGGGDFPYYAIPADGVYSLLVMKDETESATVRGYTQAVFTTTLDAAPLSVHGGAAERVATVEFDAIAGQVVGAAVQYQEYVGFCGRVELLHHGQIVQPILFENLLWDVQADGRYALAFIPCRDEGVSIPQVRLTAMARDIAVLNDSPATAVLDGPAEGAVFAFDASAGDELSVFAHRANGTAVSGLLRGPNGATLNADGTVPQTGTYEFIVFPRQFSSSYPGEIKLWASTPLEIQAELNSEPVPLGDAVRRRLDFHFSGTAGEYVTLFEDFPDPPACATTLHLYDSTGRLDSYIGPLDAVKLPHDGEYELRTYPCAAEGSIGLVSSAPVQMSPGQSARLPLSRPSAAVIVVVPKLAQDQIFDVTVSGIEIGSPGAYRAGLFTHTGGQLALHSGDASTGAFTLRSRWPDLGAVLFLRALDPYATGAMDVSVALAGP